MIEPSIYIVLGTFKPNLSATDAIGNPELSDERILIPWEPAHRTVAKTMGEELVRFSKQLSLEPFGGPWTGGPWFDHEAAAELRFNVDTRPNENKYEGHFRTDDGFHRDGVQGMGMIVWANQDPTELRWQDRIYQPQPFEIVLFNNSGPEHRQPRKSMEGRWFYRQYVRPTHPLFQLVIS